MGTDDTAAFGDHASSSSSASELESNLRRIGHSVRASKFGGYDVGKEPTEESEKEQMGVIERTNESERLYL